MNAPAMTTPPATTYPPWRRCKKAPLALFARACPAWVRPAWARTRDAAIAAPTDAFAADAACAGRWAGAVEASRLEKRGGDAADYRDAEDPSEQAGGVVDRRARAGLGLRDRPHDGLGRRSAGREPGLHPSAPVERTG